MEKRSPGIAAALNFLIPGIGYIYAQKRERFGWIVLAATVISGIYSFNKPDLLTDFTFMVGSIVLSAAFAYDVYSEMKKK